MQDETDVEIKTPNLTDKLKMEILSMYIYNTIDLFI